MACAILHVGRWITSGFGPREEWHMPYVRRCEIILLDLPSSALSHSPPFSEGRSSRETDRAAAAAAAMSRNTPCSVYIGNLDERVSEKVLYEILIQAGRVVDLHVPRDKETNKHKGYAFAEYESPEIADYAIRLFNGLVRLYNRPVRFAMSGQDKQSSNVRNPPGPPASASPSVQIPSSDAYNSREYNRLGNSNRESSNGSHEYTRRVFGSVLGDARRSHSSAAYRH